MITAAERTHAVLSASSSKQWLNCPPSARLRERFPQEPSDAAREGTLAHQFCELKLRKLFLEPGMPDKTYKAEIGKLKKEELYSSEMEHYTDEYAEYVKEIAYGYPSAPYITVEKKVDYSHVAPEGFGTADCILLHGDEMHVVDFKYGKGIAVSAEGNSQMALYALGALKAYGLIYPVDKVYLHIIQPRLRNFSRWRTSVKELNAWAEAVVKPAAQKAYEGGGQFHQGAWCDDCFCCVAGTCRARAEENVPVLKAQVDPGTGQMRSEELLTNEEIGGLLPLLQKAEPWIKKVKKAALSKLLAGETIPGWKLVEGRSNREFTDSKAAYAALIKAGYKKAMFYEQVPLPLTQAEKLITKEDYDSILAKFIIKPKGTPALAPEGDKRPPYVKDTTPEEDFGGGNAYKEGGTIC